MNDLANNPHIKFILIVFYAAVGYFFTVYLLPKLFVWLLPFLLAFFVAYLTRPIVKFLSEKWHLPNKVSALVSLLLVLLTVGSAVGYIITKIVLELINLAEKMPIYLEHLPYYIKYVTGWIKVFQDSLSPEISSVFENAFETLSSSIYSALGDIARQILNNAANFATAIPGIGIGFLVFFISCVFFCIDYDMIVSTLKRQLDPSSRKRFSEIKGYALDAITKYLKGVAIMTVIVYVVILTGLLILGINYAYLLALIIAFFDMLPLIGAGLFLIPWGAFHLFTGDIFLGIGLIALCFINSTVRQLVEPKVLSDSLGLYPIITLLSIYIGLKTIGFAGVILFPIITLVLVHLHSAGAIKLWRTDDNE